MDSAAAREGHQKIPSARLSGEHGAPVAALARVIPAKFAGRRTSADSFRKLAAKLRREPPEPEVPSAPDALPVNAASATPQARGLCRPACNLKLN